MQNMSYKYKNI